MLCIRFCRNECYFDSSAHEKYGNYVILMNLVGETNMYEVLAEGYTIRAKHIVVICMKLCMVE